MAISEDTVRSSRALWTSGLPNGWRFERFGNALDLVRRPIEVEDDRLYAQPVIRRRHGGLEVRATQRGREIKTKAQFEIRRDDWLMSKVQILHGAYGVVPSELDGAIASGSYYSFRARDNLDLSFLWYLSQLHQFHRTCALASVGVVIEKMVFRVEDWLELEFPLPPLAEQKKIAAILSSVDEAIRANEAVIEQTRRVKEGLLQELLTRGIGHTEFRETEIGPLPVGWTLASLGQYLSGVSYGTSDKADSDTSGAPVLRIPNVSSGRLDLSDLKYISGLNEDSLSRFAISSGDVLVIRTNGNPDVVGRCALVPHEIGMEPILYASYLIKLVADESRLRPRYMAEYINSKHARVYLDRERATSAGNYNINSTQLKNMPIAVPPLAEQDAICSALDAMDSAERTSRTSADRLRTLKSGLLQDLLTGKVRVTP